MMTQAEIETRAVGLLHYHGLLQQGWGFGWQNLPVRRAGQCVYDDRTVYLSSKVVTLWTLDQVDTVLLHEIAHALVGPNHGHDKIWQAKCLEIGGDGKARFNTNEHAMPKNPRARQAA
jgi:hypothetical protein